MLCNNILEAIGRTPLVKLNRVGAQLQCNLYGKCEFMNPGGSVKDRIGYKMVEDAEKSGRIKPGDTLIEPTSGNTGIGIALAGAIKGYHVIITMPEKMSREKQVILEALGARIIRTPTEAAYDAPESHIGVAKKLQRELPNAHILDQYSNPSNPAAHANHTAQEILDDLNGKVDMIVAGAGTGGTITGIAQKIKQVNPKVRIVGADPVGSILAGGDFVSSYKVEGIGYDFIPDVLHRDLIDEWVKTNDRQSFLLARRLIREEGLLVGGSSGSALFAALTAAKSLRPGQNCVVILPDGVRNYMTKFVEDKWMQINNFFGPDKLDGEVGVLLKRKPELQLVTIDENTSAHSAVQLMKSKGISQIPVISNGRLVGILTEVGLLQNLSALQKIDPSLKVSQVMERNVPTVEEHTPLNALQEILLSSGRAVVIDRSSRPVHIVTKIDLVEWMMSE
jgi:cystathionine beta-synthase